MQQLEETTMRTHRLFILSTFLLSLSLAPGSPIRAADPTPAEIDRVFTDYDRTTSPGCTLGVVRGGELVYKYGAAQAYVDGAAPGPVQHWERAEHEER